MYQFIAADKETNTVYLITFESPSDEWEQVLGNWAHDARSDDVSG
ncbi:MAG: hypothetical protein U0X93_03860 [Anaerolineales bacterium]